MLSAAGSGWSARRFVWANIAQEYVNLFNRVIEMGSVFGAAPDVSSNECTIDRIEGKASVLALNRSLNRSKVLKSLSIQ